MTSRRIPQLEWPVGGLQWKPEWQALLPALRGVRTPTPPDLDALLAEAPLRGEAAAKDELTRARLAAEAREAAGLEAWLQLYTGGGVQLAWLVTVCAGLRGAAFALEVALALATRCGVSHPVYATGLLGPLRNAVACATTPEYDAALAVAEREYTRSDFAERAFAYVFAHRADWVAAWLAKPDDGWYRLLRDCPMPAPVFQARDFFNDRFAGLDELLPCVLLQCHLHGEQALDSVVKLLDRTVAAGEPKNITLACQLAAAFRAPGMLDVVADRIEHKKLRDVFDKLADAHPVAALLVAIRRMLSRRTRAAESFALRLAARHADALPSALAELDATGRARFAAVQAALAPPEAPADALPPLLRDPPWLRADRPGELPVLQVEPILTPEAVDLSPELRKAALELDVNHSSFKPRTYDANGFATQLNFSDEDGRRLLGGQPLQPEDYPAPESRYGLEACLALAPEAAQVALWNSYPAGWLSYASWEAGNPQHAMLARHGLAVLPGMLSFLGSALGKGPGLALLLDTPALVDRMAHLLHMPSHGPGAAEWMLKYPGTVLFHALPKAFAAEASRERDEARRAIRWLAAQGQPAQGQVQGVAAAYGGDMPAAVQALQVIDPLFLLPATMPRLPGFFEPANCRRPLLANGAGALPASALPHIVHMLMIGHADAPYAGLATVKAACTPASLAEFAWDLYEAWAGAGAPPKDNWAYRALALLGDDETARRLLPRINEWSADAAFRARAEAGVTLLARMGSEMKNDVALMVLNVLATKGRHKRVKQKAAEFIASAAQARDLSTEELADRLVPTLGLDDPEAHVFDFGPRRFTLGFDETLKPFVRDAKGARLKDLPKPLKSDDEALAKAAGERYKALKKDAKTIASLQVMRLEQAMLEGRIWTGAEFRQLFLQHPLMSHLATRLAWGVFDGKQCTHALRVAEDWTLADSADALFTLDDEAVIGIPHVLELPEPERQALTQLFADYELLQPFAQLARETFSLTPEERMQDTLTRWSGKDVAAGSLLGLAQWKWQRGTRGHGGMIRHYEREANGGLTLMFEFSPGIFAGGGQPDYRQTLGKVRIFRTDNSECPESPPPDRPPRFADLDAVHASELIRDLELLAPARDDIP